MHRLVREDLIPVVATVAVDEAGQAYNINADAVAGAIAEALGAEKLVYLTNVAGLYRSWPDETSLISRLGVDELEELMTVGALSEGMIPRSSRACRRFGMVSPALTFSTGACPTRCCSSSSPAKASAR